MREESRLLKCSWGLTSMDQGKRLVEMGIPVNTADYAWVPDGEYEGGVSVFKPYPLYKNQHLPENTLGGCWSIGQLLKVIYVLEASTLGQDSRPFWIERDSLLCEELIETILELTNKGYKFKWDVWNEFSDTAEYIQYNSL